MSSGILPGMGATKTTFYLSDSLRRRLKALAARRGRTVTDLLAEGAELVLARDQEGADRDELRRRADAARERVRRGLYSGAPVADDVDRLLYGPPPGRRARRG